MNRTIFLLILFAITYTSMAQTVIPLYEGEIPNSKPGVRKSSEPTLGIFLPSKEKVNGAAIIVMPGGGYV